jgi:hypothetical protein
MVQVESRDGKKDINFLYKPWTKDVQGFFMFFDIVGKI